MANLKISCWNSSNSTIAAIGKHELFMFSSSNLAIWGNMTIVHGVFKATHITGGPTLYWNNVSKAIIKHPYGLMIYTTHENGGVILYSTLKSEYLICLWQWDVNLEHRCRATSQVAQLLKPRKGIPRVHLHLTLLHECSLRLDQGGPGHPLEATGYPEVDLEKNADFKAMVSRSENNLPLLAFQHSYGTWPTSRWFTT